MSPRRKHPISALVAMLASALCLGAALPAAAQMPTLASLAGQLLIASPSMDDPNFRCTVILMVQHNREGAFEIISIGRSASVRSRISSRSSAKREPRSRARWTSLPAVRPTGHRLRHSQRRLSSARNHRRGRARGHDGQPRHTARHRPRQGPKQSLIAFGYAGWGPGQLEGEVAPVVTGRSRPENRS